MGLFNFEKLKEGLRRTRESFLGKIQNVISLKPVIDAEFLVYLEETLVSSDVGIATTERLINNLKTRSREERYDNAE
ncbi:MAG: signal recognition particle receptor subunit alpha, partial [Bacteroidota bacterium]